MRFLLTQEKEVDMFRNSGRVGVLLMVALVMSLPLFADGITPNDVDRAYGFTCSGTAAGAPFTQIGQVTCESKHSTCAATFFQNIGGVEITLKATGPFTLDKNGVGFITYDVGPGLFSLPIRFVVVDGGREVHGMPIVPGYDVLCELKAQ
jgi:hypothetical protein